MNTITRFLIACCLFYLASYSVLAQPTLYSKVMTDSQGLQAYCVEKTMDHNLIIAGEKNSNAIVLKIDSSGSVLWSKTIGNSGGTFYSLTVTRDSCFVLAGFAYNQGDSSDLFCVKINSAGDTLWTRMIDMGYEDEVISIRQTLDNGFILTGDASGEKIVVVKLDASGNLSWGKLFSVDNYKNFGCGVDQTADTGFIVTGYFRNNTNYDAIMYLMKLTSTGSVSWTKQLDIPYPNYSMGFDARVVQGGIMNYLYVSNGGIILMKTDISGNVLWSKSYSAYPFKLAGASFRLHQTSDSGYVIVTGNPFSESTIKVDSVGNVQFSQSLVLISTDIIESDDGDFLIIGNGPIIGTKQNQDYYTQIGIIRTDSSGTGLACTDLGDVTSTDYSASFSDVACTSQSAGTTRHLTAAVTNLTMSPSSGCIEVEGGINELKNRISINVFPNPTDGVFNITAGEAGKNEVQLVEVFNTLGERIYASSDPSKLLSPINIEWAQDGVYNVKVSFKTTSCFQKVLVCH